MRKRGLVAATIAAAAMVVLAGGLMASNMGFKLNYPLAVTGTATGTNTLALPYNPQVGMTNASHLFVDMNPANVLSVQKFLPASDSFQAYGFGSTDFALVPGEGYLIKAAVDFNYIVVGSHDPSATVNLQLTGTATGTNVYSPPYHATAATAKDLFLEVGPANVLSVQKFLPASDSFQAYGFGSTDFALVPGEAYYLKMAADVPSFQPAHY
jgi:hypothetical protein